MSTIPSIFTDKLNWYVRRASEYEDSTDVRPRRPKRRHVRVKHHISFTQVLLFIFTWYALIMTYFVFQRPLIQCNKDMLVIKDGVTYCTVRYNTELQRVQ